MTANTQLSNSEIATTWNSERKKWPVASLDKPMGPKAAMPIIVAPSKANWVLFTEFDAASAGVSPLLTPMTMPSATTIPLSTNMPIAIIRAPNDIRCSSIPIMDIMHMVPSTVSSKAAPTTAPALHPIKRQSAAITEITDNAKLLRN